jgi:hypothetical protein
MGSRIKVPITDSWWPLSIYDRQDGNVNDVALSSFPASTKALSDNWDSSLSKSRTGMVLQELVAIGANMAITSWQLRTM